MAALREAMLSPCRAAMGMKASWLHAHRFEEGAEFDSICLKRASE
jgi:hypothetical protein